MSTFTHLASGPLKPLHTVRANAVAFDMPEGLFENKGCPDPAKPFTERESTVNCGRVLNMALGVFLRQAVVQRRLPFWRSSL